MFSLAHITPVCLSWTAPTLLVTYQPPPQSCVPCVPPTPALPCAMQWPQHLHAAVLHRGVFSTGPLQRRRLQQITAVVFIACFCLVITSGDCTDLKSVENYCEMVYESH